MAGECQMCECQVCECQVSGVSGRCGVSIGCMCMSGV